MRRVLFLVTERTGSTFVTAMLLGKAGTYSTGLAEGISYPTPMNVVGEQLQYWHHSCPGKRVVEDLIKARPVISTPEVYTWLPPGNLAPSFYSNLPGGDWRFVYLVRDFRNRIESRCQRACYPGSNGKPRDTKLWPIAFENECKVARFEMDSISKMLDDERFYLLRFEDLVKDPYGAFSAAMRHAGFEIDEGFYKALIKEQNSKHINSAFGDRGASSNERWHAWSRAERGLFLKTAGAGLITLGYEKDNSWVRFTEEAPKLEKTPKPRRILSEPKPVAKRESEPVVEKKLTDEKPARKAPEEKKVTRPVRPTKKTRKAPSHKTTKRTK